MSAVLLNEWIDRCSLQLGHWYVKRLSANDTQANGSHQAGPYVPNYVAFAIFPELNHPEIRNHRVGFQMVACSHRHATHARVIWYNNRLSGGTRNETRITGLGGSASPLLDPENTGALALFFFTGSEDDRRCEYWICHDNAEEAVAELFAGPVEPGQPSFWTIASDGAHGHAVGPGKSQCWLPADELPLQWLQNFPSPQDVFDMAISLRPYSELPTDERLLRRRDCEYTLFKSVEHAVESAAIAEGFSSIDAFVKRAQTVLQRRKARSGRSLELQLQTILGEERVNFAHQPTTESGHHPDFLFPSEAAYGDSSYPADKLRMLAAKTTIRERWRQILEEADRISTKHLLTLQEGVSEQQFGLMHEADVRLVVPRSLHSKYPAPIRSQLLTLEDFVDELRDLYSYEQV